MAVKTLPCAEAALRTLLPKGLYEGLIRRQLWQNRVAAAAAL